MFASRGTALRGLAFSLAIFGMLGMSSSAQSGAPGDFPQGRIDKRFTGAWLLLKQSNVMPSGLVPSAIDAVYIHDDGNIDGVGVNAASGVLSKGCPLSAFLWDRKILWADSTTFQFTQQDVQTKEPEVCDGRWRVNRDTLYLSLHNAFLGRWTEEYLRVSIGDSVAVPLQIKADLLINGEGVRLVEVSSTPPGSVNVMQLDTATHITIHFEGRTESGQTVRIDVRVHDYRGPGEYQVDLEKPAGLLSVKGAEVYEKMKMNKLSSGTVRIMALDLESSRCSGTLDVQFDQKFGNWPTALSTHLSGSFDLPIWISTEYDIKLYRIRRPDSINLINP